MAQTKFFEVIKPNHNFEFIGRQNLFIGLSAFLILLSIVMLPINHFLRGSTLNYSIEFRGGTEMSVEFSAPQEPQNIRSALAAGGFHDAEVVKLIDQPNAYILRIGSVSALTSDASKKLESALATKYADDKPRMELSEGGDKVYLRFPKAKQIEQSEIGQLFKDQGVGFAVVNRYGRPEDNTFEIVLVSVNSKVQESLDSKLGPNSVKQILASDSVGAKAGKELRDDGIKSMLFAILCIMVYIAIRFDFRYGPGTVAALLHDAFLVMGAFAITYKEFSLTTVAAILTVIGYSMNDTIVVFDRIRENAARMRDKRFDRVVNASINETLSRTILTSLTVFLVTLFMNILGSGTIREFAFAMNVGVIVGTYSSIFIAAPILIWLNERFYKTAPNARPAKNTL